MSKNKRIGIIAAAIVAVIVVVAAVMAASSAPVPPPPPPPDPPPPSEIVSWAIEETTVHATITRPDGDGPYPAVVFVPGTGPTDRDWNAPHLPGPNPSGILLAEELARRGFVTIRYDKRYAGPGAEENIPHLTGKISLAGHVEEIAGAVETLLAQDYVDPDRIYVLSHGEGAFHALNYHLEYVDRLAGLVLTTPPAPPPVETFIEQIRDTVRPMPGGNEIAAAFEALVADFLDGKPFVDDPAVPDSLKQHVRTWNEPGNLPFMREILPLDPADLLAQVTVPTLVVIGKKDIEIDWQVDGALLQAATDGLAHITYQFPRNADRVLKYEPTPRQELTPATPGEYNAEGRILDQETLWLIADWFNEPGQSG